jgi:hypothetical protein
MNPVHRGLLLVEAAVDGENFAWKPCPDLLFSRGLCLRRRQDCCFFGLFGEALLGASADD